MPRVPTYDEPTVALRPLPNVAVRPTQTALPEVGRALESAGADLGEIARRQQEQRNVDAVMRAETELKNEYLGFENSARERRGTQAWGLTKQATDWWDKNGPKYTNQLENEAQRRAFGHTVSELRQQSLTTLSRFEADQRRASVEDSTKASIAAGIGVAAANAGDPEAVAKARADVVRRLAMLAMTNGWTPERLQLEQQQTLTRLHQEVLQNLVDVNPEAASEYLDAHQDDIDGTALDDLGKLVRLGNLRARAQAGADEIMAQGLPASEAIAEARKRYSGEERDEVVTRIKTRYAERAAARQEVERANADAAWDIFARTHSVASLPTQLVDNLDGKTLLSLQKEEAARLKGSEVATDWELFYGLRQRALQDPRAFAAADLRQFFGDLNPTERRQLIALQERVRSPSSLPDVATLTQQLAVAHNMLDLNAEDRGRFDSAVQQALDAEQTHTGRKLTYDERQKVIDRMMIQGEVAGAGLLGLFDANRRFYEVAGTGDEARFQADVPVDDKDQISALLEREGYPVTDETIAALFAIANELPGADAARKLLSRAGTTQDETPTGDVPRVTSDAEYDALPSGTVFVAPDGTTRRKP